MNIIKDYQAYLADNPEGHWFKRKLYGYGWTPATKEGWLVTGAYVAVVFGLVFAADQMMLLQPEQIFLPAVALTMLFLAIIVRTGESPKWQWGNDDREQN